MMFHSHPILAKAGSIRPAKPIPFSSDIDSQTRGRLINPRQTQLEKEREYQEIPSPSDRLLQFASRVRI